MLLIHSSKIEQNRGLIGGILVKPEINWNIFEENGQKTVVDKNVVVLLNLEGGFS